MLSDFLPFFDIWKVFPIECFIFKVATLAPGASIDFPGFTFLTTLACKWFDSYAQDTSSV